MTLTQIAGGATKVLAGEYSANEFAISIRRKHLSETVELDYDQAAQLFDLLGSWLENEAINEDIDFDD